MADVESIHRPAKTLTERAQKVLLRVTGEHRAGFRDHVIYALALGTGLRAHELLALNVGDVFDAEGRARRRVQLRVFKRSNPDEAAQEVVLGSGLRAKLERGSGRPASRLAGSRTAPTPVGARLLVLT